MPPADHGPELNATQRGNDGFASRHAPPRFALGRSDDPHWNQLIVRSERQQHWSELCELQKQRKAIDSISLPVIAELPDESRPVWSAKDWLNRTDRFAVGWDDDVTYRLLAKAATFHALASVATFL
jgi:hypothetical protein